MCDKLLPIKALLSFIFCIFLSHAVKAQDSIMVYANDSVIAAELAGRKGVLEELIKIRELQERSETERAKVREERRRFHEIEDPSNEYGAMLKVADNTSWSFFPDGWTLFGILTFIVSFVTLVATIATYYSQRETEKHTQNAPVSAQIGQFKDLTRHFYRNLVCTSAAIARFKDKSNRTAKGKDARREAFPSESHFNKLKTMPDDVVLNIDVNERTYAKLHELKVLLRNYNIEVDVAMEHVSKPWIWEKALAQDFDNLLFKPFHLVESTLEIEKFFLSPDSGDRPLLDRSVMIVMAEHFEKFKKNICNLGKKSCQYYLKVFFGSDQFDASLDDAIKKMVKDVQANYMAAIDEIGGVKRSLGKLKKTVIKKELIDYLDSLDARFDEEVEAMIKDNKKALRWVKCKKVLRKVVRISCGEQEHQIKLLNASIEQMQKTKDERNNKDENKLSSLIQDLSKVSDYDSFMKLGIKYEEPKRDAAKAGEYVSYKDLYQSLRPYISYVSQEQWNFGDFLYLMLAVDVAIECDRIGMVNYA